MKIITFISILLSYLIFNYLLNNLNNDIIAIYKNPLFKILFLFGLYYFGNNNIYLTIIFSIYYIYLGQKIQEKELLHNII